MAGSLELELTFHEPVGPEGERDCGTRTAIMPLSLPALGDDFVWESRDFDGFRMAMLEELAARFPERARWTPADLEVVLVEVLAWALDQLSDMLDRVTAEAYIETARRPESVRRLLNLFGCDAGDDDEKNWLQNPVLMDAARHAGPKSVRRQRRMVGVDDYAEGMEQHPLVRRAVSSTTWNNCWHCIRVTVILWGWQRLGDNLGKVFNYLPTFEPLLTAFHEQYNLPRINAITDEKGITVTDEDGNPVYNLRVVDSLRAWSDSRRMAGQEVLFGEAARVGVDIGLDITIAPQYYQSEVRQAVRAIFNSQEGGFFEIGRLSFGANLHKGDVIQTVMQIEGIASVEVKAFRRTDSDSGAVEDIIAIEGFEVAVCDNDPNMPCYGALTIKCHGGLVG